ncbi:MAG: hypothetical protein KDD47_11770 [Acidobacteria bacterium]|nr:hypothetical protein [Acidobacteriota bacterium]
MTADTPRAPRSAGTSREDLPIAILGAGPVGLEAALAAAEAGRPFVLYEAGDRVASSVRDWGHVRLFSPWSMDVSDRMRRFLEAAGHEVPEGDECPTGQELFERVLDPISRLPAIAHHLRLGVRILGIGRKGLVKNQEIASPARASRPFLLLLGDDDGREWTETASAVLDCTGSYEYPNTLGDGGIPAPGERSLDSEIVRRIPDLDSQAEDWANRSILLVGSGHSAQTAACALAHLAEEHPETRVYWVLRRSQPAFSMIEDDPLPERSQLISKALTVACGDAPGFEPRYGFVVEGLERDDHRIRVTLRGEDGDMDEVVVDRILSLTGAVGDHNLYRQLQVHECYATSGPMKLAAALLGQDSGGDCLAQTSHGPEVLRNPEPDFYILGSKSYGRNSTFLLRVGWRQVDEVMGLLESP